MEIGREKHMHRQHRIQRVFAMISILVLLALVGAAFSAALPTRALEATPPPAAQAQPARQVAASAPPTLLETLPARDAAWNGDTLTLRFDQPLDPTAADYLTVSPPLAGTTTVAGAEIFFTPDEALQPGTLYTLRLAAGAMSEAGVPLASPIEVAFATRAPLIVTSTQPADGTTQIDTTAQLLVVFNRPVVALSGVDDQADLPSPLTIEPAVAGEGRWLSTSVFAFRPDPALAGATRYTVTVDGITDLEGQPLAEPVVFSFTTADPIVVERAPTGNQVPPDTAVTVDFSQPMDPDSTTASFSLRRSADNAPVEGTVTWHNDNRTLIFTPTTWLDFGAAYQLDIADSAQPLSRQGNLRDPYSWSFTVVPLPAVASVSPVDGAQEVSPDTSVVIRFNTPLSPTTVLENVQVSSPLTSTRVYSYYSEYMSELQLSWFKQPATTYTVTLGAEIADFYGNSLGEDVAFSFTTGDYPPLVRLEADRFTHYTAYSDTRVGVLFRNVDEVNIDLYRLPGEELFKLTGTNQWDAWQAYQVPNAAANRIWSRTYAVDEAPNVTVRQIVTLTDALGNELAPGVYFIDLQQPPTNSEEPTDATGRQAVVVISDLNLTFKKSDTGTSLAWLTDLRTGQPVGDVPIRFYREGELVDETTTADDGIATRELRPPVETAWAPVLVMAGEPGDDSFALVSSDWSSGIAIWDFNLYGGWALDGIQSHFYTDRPIYRPGQTVHWNGIVRTLVDDIYTIPPNDLRLTVILRDPQGNTLYEDALALDAMGTVNGQFDLADEAVTGGYYIEVQFPLGGDRITFAGTSFAVAAYRVPEFDITVAPARAWYGQGDTVQINVQANYFSGGPLAQAPVTWRLISAPYTFNWQQAPEDGDYSFQPFDPDQAVYDPYAGFQYLGLIREGTGTTAADGSFVIELPADLADAAQSQNWTFDVTLQSPSNQFVGGQTTVPVHKSDFYIGVSPRQYLVAVGESAFFDFVTVAPDGARVADRELDIVIYNYEWNNLYTRNNDGVYRWETSIVRTPIYTTSVTTDATGEATVEWVSTIGGQFELVAQSTDDAGNPTSSIAFLWVSEPDPTEFVAWPRANNDRIELVADKSLYAPGETAQVLVPSPFTGPVQALLTIERSGVVSSQVITLTSNSETLEIPITTAEIPNIFVGVVIAKGIDETNPTPAMRIGYVQINVDTAAKALDLNVTSSATQVTPGSSVAYTVTVTNSAGEPVPNTQMSVALVDRAIFALAPGEDQPLIDVFYYQRPLGVSTSALLTINHDRLSAQLSENAKGGGGGGDGGGMDVRSEFPDTAFWRADLTTDADGIATFTVDLPDNLTTWRLVVKAVTVATEVGNSTYDIVATKDLQVRPILPRFVTLGDQVEIGAVVINTTDQPLTDGDYTVAITGADFAPGVATAGTFTLAAGEQLRRTWPIMVNGVGNGAGNGAGNDVAQQVVITVTARTGGDNPAADAVQMTLPIVRYTTREVVATSGAVPPEGVVEGIRVPATATDDGELEVTVEPSLAAGMVAGLDYLASYPYQCTEQVVSSFLPNLFAARTLATLNLNDLALTEDLTTATREDLQRLINRQNQDGGWGYWPGERSSVFITAYALWGLSMAQTGGYTVPAGTLDNAAGFIERAFVAPDRITNAWQLNEMSFMLYVLSEIGRGDPGRTSTLYDVRERLSLYGQAYLAMTLANLQADGTDDPRVATLLDSLFGAANVTGTGAWWQEESIDFRNLNTDTRTTAIVLAAFLRLEPEQPLIPQVVRWLMEMRTQGHWSTTQETAWSLIALTDWLELTGELNGDYLWTVTLNDTELGSGDVDTANVVEPVILRAEVASLLRDEVNLLKFDRDGQSGRMYYTTDFRYTVDAATVAPRDRGVVIDRRFALDQAGQPTVVSSAQVGDIISVTVTIIAPTDLFHLLVEVPIPAGTEPIDPSLANTAGDFGIPELTQLPEGEEPAGWWQSWTPSYTDMRDDKVAVFATFLGAGTYEYTFTVRAAIPGEYRVLPAYAEQMYFPDVWGRTGGTTFTVTP
jgi:uncharacterized protein YfaS (alpha-2-macroglobulin family)